MRSTMELRGLGLLRCELLRGYERVPRHDSAAFTNNEETHSHSCTSWLS